jgi:hypothetical protein
VKEGEFEITRGFDYMTMVRFGSIHSIRVVNASNNVLLGAREFSYFCCHYIDDVPGDCISKGYVEPWKLVTLEPCEATNVLCDVEYDENVWGVGEENNDLVVGLSVGDNFAIVIALDNYEGVDFFILQCVKELHIVEKDSKLNDE